MSLVISDFQPIKVLLPRTSGRKTLHLTSEIDQEKYPFTLSTFFHGAKQEILLESTTMIENMTDMSLGIYVQSDNLHWQMLGCAQSSDNPFEVGVKLTELHSHSMYNVPVALSKQAEFYIKPTDQR